MNKGKNNEVSVIDMKSTAEFKTELNPESISRATAHKYRKMVDTVKAQVTEDLELAEKAREAAIKVRGDAIEKLVKQFQGKTVDKRIVAASNVAQALQNAHHLTDKQKFEVHYDAEVDNEKKLVNMKISVGHLNADRGHYNHKTFFSIKASLKFNSEVKDAIAKIDVCDEHLKTVRRHNQVVLEMMAQQSTVCEEVNMQLVDLFLSGGGVTHLDIKDAMAAAAKDILMPKLKMLPEHVSQLMLPATTK